MGKFPIDPVAKYQSPNKKRKPSRFSSLTGSLLYQSSSSSLLEDIACCLAFKASASEPARPGWGVLLRLLSLPLAFKLMPESLGCRAAGFLAAMGRFAGGWGGVGLDRTPFWPGAGGGARGAGAGAGAGGGACSST